MDCFRRQNRHPAHDRADTVPLKILLAAHTPNSFGRHWQNKRSLTLLRQLPQIDVPVNQVTGSSTASARSLPIRRCGLAIGSAPARNFGSICKSSMSCAWRAKKSAIVWTGSPSSRNASESRRAAPPDSCKRIGRRRNRDHMRYVTQQPCLVCDRQLVDARQTRVASHVPKQSQKQDIAMAIELPRALGEQSCPELRQNRRSELHLGTPRPI